MKGIFIQNGNALDYTNSGAAKIEAGDAVSLGGRLGVAGTDMEVGETGSVHMVGVFRMPKAAEDFAMGEALYFAAQGGLTKTAAGAAVGYAAAPAGAGDAEGLVKLLG